MASQGELMLKIVSMGAPQQAKKRRAREVLEVMQQPGDEEEMDEDQREQVEGEVAPPPDLEDEDPEEEAEWAAFKERMSRKK